MGENTEDERVVAEFWQRRGFVTQALESPSDRFSRQPDLLLSRNGRPWAYCEVKTIWRHRWKVTLLHDDRPVEERTERSEKPVDERICGDLLTALGQLHATNPAHSILNVVVLVNRDPEASPAVLGPIFSKKPPVSRRTLKARMEAKTVERLQRFRHEVDLCLWTTISEAGALDVEGYFSLNPGSHSIVSEVAGLRAEKQITLEPAA
jgi:hypothetical protein